MSGPPHQDPDPGQEETWVGIGPYKLLHLLGQGGMGRVFLAQQTEPVRRKVAIKLLRAEEIGNEAITRFNLEQQNLARLSHPNIAGVFDAGLDRLGRPYFVMEYVDGLPITQYCDQKQLTVPDRIQLFIRVCQAVQYAHQRGIIHRDLKPRNLLVTEKEGLPVPKIIDFGISKVLRDQTGQEPLTVQPDDNPLTRTGMVIGTIGYMSPEQALSDEEVDTRSDVYSLGALLYELLTGRAPFILSDFQGLPIAIALLKLGSQNPIKPSSRITKSYRTGESGYNAAEAATARKESVLKLSHLLRGDLDWITMKALAQDKERRYAGAADLAADLVRYLEHKPVEAGPPGVLYIARKFFQRNKLAVSLTVLFLFAVSVAFFRTRAAEQRALEAALAGREEAQKTRQTLDIMNQLLTAPDPRNLGKNVTFLQVLDDFHRRINEFEAVDPAVIMELRTSLGVAYGNLGYPRKASREIDLALAYLESVGEETNPGYYSLVMFAIGLQLDLNNLAEVERRLNQNIDLLFHPEDELRRHYLALYSNYLLQAGKTEQYDIFIDNHREEQPTLEFISLHVNIMTMLTELGRHQEAEETLAQVEKTIDTTKLNYFGKISLGSFKVELAERLGNSDQALTQIKTLREEAEQMVGRNQDTYLQLIQKEMRLHQKAGDPESCIALGKKTLAENIRLSRIQGQNGEAAANQTTPNRNVPGKEETQPEPSEFNELSDVKRALITTYGECLEDSGNKEEAETLRKATTL